MTRCSTINSEDSTVSLENVKSYGTEGRKGDPDEEVPPADQIYEYIVFRGSDVKDLRIEEAPLAKENMPPNFPNDPAILGVSCPLLSWCSSCHAVPTPFLWEASPANNDELLRM